MKNRLNANKGKYEVIARLLRDCENVEDAVIKLGDYFQTKDETFDYDRWADVCSGGFQVNRFYKAN